MLIHLKKNTTSTIRINDKIKQALKEEGITVQQIIDNYIRENYDVDIRSHVYPLRKEVKDE